MRSIDLHGLVLHDAWKKFNTFVFDCYISYPKTTVKVITGQGAMMKEFSHWASANTYIKSYKQAEFNPGAWVLKLK